MKSERQHTTASRKVTINHTPFVRRDHMFKYQNLDFPIKLVVTSRARASENSTGFVNDQANVNTTVATDHNKYNVTRTRTKKGSLRKRFITSCGSDC